MDKMDVEIRGFLRIGFHHAERAMLDAQFRLCAAAQNNSDIQGQEIWAGFGAY
ncbi:MAG: hypothetical protein ACI9P3_003104 [Bradyrhizobium sp.]|jgi:hypothetical protein